MGYCWYFQQGLSRVRFVILGAFLQDLAITGIHGYFSTGLHGNPPRGNQPHGNSRGFLYGNRPPREIFTREVATTGIHGIFGSANYARGGVLGNAHAAGPLCLRGCVVGALKPRTERGSFWFPASEMAFRCGDGNNVDILNLYYLLHKYKHQIVSTPEYYFEF